MRAARLWGTWGLPSPGLGPVSPARQVAPHPRPPGQPRKHLLFDLQSGASAGAGWGGGCCPSACKGACPCVSWCWPEPWGGSPGGEGGESWRSPWDPSSLRAGGAASRPGFTRLGGCAAVSLVPFVCVPRPLLIAHDVNTVVRSSELGRRRPPSQALGFPFAGARHPAPPAACGRPGLGEGRSPRHLPVSRVALWAGRATTSARPGSVHPGGGLSVPWPPLFPSGLWSQSSLGCRGGRAVPAPS